MSERYFGKILTCDPELTEAPPGRYARPPLGKHEPEAHAPFHQEQDEALPGGVSLLNLTFLE